MYKDGENKHGLQTTNLKHLGKFFSRCTNRGVAPLQSLSDILSYSKGRKLSSLIAGLGALASNELPYVWLVFRVLLVHCSLVLIAGWIYDITKSYPLSFIAASVFSATGCILLFLIPLLQVSQKRLSHTPETTDRVSHLERGELDLTDTNILRSSLEPVTTEQSSESIDQRTRLQETCL